MSNAEFEDDYGDSEEGRSLECKGENHTSLTADREEELRKVLEKS